MSFTRLSPTGARPARFGIELIIDLYACHVDRLTSSDDLREYVAGLVKLIGMKTFGPCMIEHFGHGSPVTAGYSVAQWIETSLISLHLSPYLRTAHINIFSCKDFDPEVALAFSEEFFDAEASIHVVLER